MSNQINNANISNTDNDQDESEKSSPENADQQGYLGSESDPELATENNTLETAQEMGLYPGADDEHPVPVGELTDSTAD